MKFSGFYDRNEKKIYIGSRVKFLGDEYEVVEESGSIGIGTHDEIDYGKIEDYLFKHTWELEWDGIRCDNFISFLEIKWNLLYEDNYLDCLELI